MSTSPKPLPLGLCAFVCFTAKAAIVAVPGSSPVKINAKLGDDSGFSGGVELMSEAKVTDLLMRSDDLLRQDRQATIGRQQITLANPGKLNFDAATPTYVGIKLAGIKEPGTYNGNLYFFFAGAGLSPALTFPIQVVARSTPA